MINVKEKHLVRAFREHVGYVRSVRMPAGTVLTRTSRLVLLYAVECGVKALLLRRNRFQTTDDLRQSEDWIEHDVNTGLGRLGADKDCRLPKTMRVRDHSRPLHVGEYHEAWRYGVLINTNDEAESDQSLDRAVRWIESQIAGEVEAS